MVEAPHSTKQKEKKSLCCFQAHICITKYKLEIDLSQEEQRLNGLGKYKLTEYQYFTE